MLAAMLRRLSVPVAFLPLLVSISACNPAPVTGESTPAPRDTALAAPSPADGGAARELRDRYAATQRLVGLAEIPDYTDEKLDSDGVVCGQPLPLLDQRLVAVARVFATPDDAAPQEFAEVNQETVVYPSEAVAAEAIRQFFDLLEVCGQDVEAGQVTDGHTAAHLPTKVRLPGRAVTAAMTIPDGTTFPHRYGCLHHLRVVQCIAVWTRSAERTAAWFEKAIIATEEGLQT